MNSEYASDLKGSRGTSGITDGHGYLLRDRPGCAIPIGQQAADELGADLTDRDIQVLLAVEQLGYATTEQIARAFFNNHRSAYRALLRLANRRFLANLGVDAALIQRAVGHRPPTRNPTYILDWNGYYFLTQSCGYALRNWRASTAARISSRFGHAIGVSEIWSHLVAAARATQELDYLPEHEDRWRYRLAVHFRNERASRLIRRQALTGEGSSSLDVSVSPDGPLQQKHAERNRSPRSKEKVLLQPDGAFLLAINELGARAGIEAGRGDEASGLAPGERPHQEGGAQGVIYPRWDPALGSWQDALLSARPSLRDMVESEESARRFAVAANGGSEGNGNGRRSDRCTYYRTLLLEMETGANGPQDVREKILMYNRLLRTGEEAWTSAYGIAPRVLVVVRSNRQLEVQASIWRGHYIYKKGSAVLLTSLQRLAEAFGDDNQPRQDSRDSSYAGPSREARRAMLDERCWLDVMAGDSAWRSLGEALKVGTVGR